MNFQLSLEEISQLEKEGGGAGCSKKIKTRAVLWIHKRTCCVWETQNSSVCLGNGKNDYG